MPRPTRRRGSHARVRGAAGRHARPHPPVAARTGARVVAPAVLSASLVVGTAATAQAAPRPATTLSVYVVNHGDSLWSIGERQHVSWRAVARLNHIRAPFVIHTGERLLLPSSSVPSSRPAATATHVAVAPAALIARARAFVTTVGSGRPDPYFGQSSYKNLCGELAARITGHRASGYPSAIAQWRAYVAAGLAHVGDGHPPPGALLFWYTPTDGHVAVYLGSGELVTNDIYDHRTGLRGGVYLAPVSAVTHGTWRLPYLGWAWPIYR